MNVPAYVGVDPGKATGLVLFVPQTNEFTNSCHDPLDACEQVRAWLIAYPGAVLAVERYVIGGGSRRVRSGQTDALHVIGVMRWFAHVYVRDPSRFMLEGASDTARVGSRGNLVRLGWVISCPEGHCHRAAAQVALALARTAPRSLAAMFAGGSMNSPT